MRNDYCRWAWSFRSGYTFEVWFWVICFISSYVTHKIGWSLNNIIYRICSPIKKISRDIQDFRVFFYFVVVASLYFFLSFVTFIVAINFRLAVDLYSLNTFIAISFMRVCSHVLYRKHLDKAVILQPFLIVYNVKLHYCVIWPWTRLIQYLYNFVFWSKWTREWYFFLDYTYLDIRSTNL